MKVFLIAIFFLGSTSATKSSVGDIVQAMLPYCTHGQMRREVKAALEECSASCSSDETSTDGYYDATTTTGGYHWDETTDGYYRDETTDGYHWDETTNGYHWDETNDGYYWDETTDEYYWDESSTAGYNYDNDGYYDATTGAYYNVRSLSDRNFRKMFRKECPTTHYMLNKFYGRDMSAYKVLTCVEERMNEVPDGEVLRNGATLRYGCAGAESGAAVRSGCEQSYECISRINGQIQGEPDWCSAGLDVFPMVETMCNSIAFMDSCFDHMRQQFVETNGYMDQTTTSAYVPDGYTIRK